MLRLRVIAGAVRYSAMAAKRSASTTAVSAALTAIY